MNWKRNLFSLSAAQFLSMIGMTFFLPFIPLYLKEMGVESQDAISTWSGFLFAAGFLMLSLTAPLWGALADRWGRKIMVLRAMTAGCIILFLSSFAQTPHQLLALRLIHGALSGFVSSAIALISTDTPEDSLGFSLGIFQGTLMGGLVVGPFLGGLFQDILGLRATLRWASLLSLVGVAIVLLFVHETKKNARPHKPTSIWENAQFLFKNTTLWPAVRIVFLSNMSLMAIPPILALCVIQMLGPESAVVGRMSGVIFSASAISMMITMPLWGRLSDRWGQKRVLTLCLFLSGLSFIPQGLAQTFPQLLLSRLLLGAVMGGIGPSIQSLIASQTPHYRRAGVLGISFSFNMMGNAVGPLIGGTVAASLGLQLPFFLTAAVLLLAAWMSLSLRLQLQKAPANPITETV